MKKEMLINVLQPEECRIAIVENGVLEELYVERTSHESYVGNIYKGRIVNIEPSIQAAFVDFGVGRNGFLHVSDVEPTYYQHLEDGHQSERGERGERNDRGDRNDRGERSPRGDRNDRGGDRGSDHGSRGRGRGRDRGREPTPRENEREQLDRRRASAWVEEDLRGDGVNLTVPPEPRASDSSSHAIPPERPTAFGQGLDDLDTIPPPVHQTELFQQDPELFEHSPETHSDALLNDPLDVSPEVVETIDDENVPPVVAHPETLIEEEPARNRRRSRTSGRRKKGPEPRAGETPEIPHNDPPEPPKPRLMDSAERRTDRGEESGSHREPIEDDLLFFPRPVAPATPVHRPEKIEPPVSPVIAVPESSLPPEILSRSEADDSPETSDPPEPAEAAPIRPRTPPRRPRPEGRSQRSIEEVLAADLAAVDGEDDVLPSADESLDGGFDGGDMDREPEDQGEDAPPSGFRRGSRDRGRDAGRDGGRDRGSRGGRDRGRDAGRDGGRNMRPGMSGRPGMLRPKPNIQDIFKRGQEVLVQVIKEGIGSKGPTLSTYISIAGRYLVLMPGLNRVGVSRKIPDDETRRKLREMFMDLKPPRGLGFIIRTAVVDKNKKELHRDLCYLSRLYQVVYRRIKKIKAPAEVYQESDMITRTIRDTFTSDIDTIWIDEPTAFEHAQEFMQIVMPRYANRIKLFESKEPIFQKYGIEEEISRIQQKKVPLPNGGSIIIEQTEALVAIDVNSGNFRADGNAEQTAFQINLQAAKEIARQLRLRDLGGVIVNDFIDMRDEKHRRAVEKAMHDAVRRDRARTKVLKISPFGIIEMTRQRIRPSLKRSVYQDCPYCHSMGQVKTQESMSIEVMRLLQLVACRENVARVEVHVTEEVAGYLLNRKRKEVAKLEEQGNISVEILGKPGQPPELLHFVCFDRNDHEVALHPQQSEPPMRRR